MYTRKKEIAHNVTTMMWASQLPVREALSEAGVRTFTALRILAEALYWVDKIPASLLGHADRHLTWTVLRLGIKMMLSDERGDKALKLLTGPFDVDRGIVRSLECKMLMSMESADSESDASPAASGAASPAASGATPLHLRDIREFP